MKKESFWLDPAGGAYVLQIMAKGQIAEQANRVANRAKYMASSVSSQPLEFTVKTSVGTISRGERIIGTVTAEQKTEHQAYIARTILRQAIDAGKL
mgnify:CR=1 FL=1